MVEVLARAGMAANFVANAAIGGRLLWLAARTRQLPELLLGAGCLGLGVGAVVVVVGTGMLDTNPGLSRTLVYVGSALTSAGAGFSAVAAWRIFRPASSWAAALACLACALLAACWLLLLQAAGTDPTRSLFYRVGLAMRIGALLWLGAESLRYASALRRRRALGLAEPMMVVRFLLWGIAATGGGVSLLVYAVTVALELKIDDLPAVMSAVGVIGLISGGSLALAFFPGARLRSWLEAESS